jgi:hypothetical protein
MNRVCENILTNGLNGARGKEQTMSYADQITVNGKTYQRYAWTGGDTPRDDEEKHNPDYAALVEWYYNEQVEDCGGLDLWECAGTSVEDRKAIFRNRARLDAWRTFERNLILSH